MSTPLLSALLSLLELELAAAQSGGNTASTVVASEVSTADSSNATSSVGGWNSAGYGDESWGQVRQDCPLAALLSLLSCCWTFLCCANVQPPVAAQMATMVGAISFLGVFVLVWIACRVCSMREPNPARPQSFPSRVSRAPALTALRFLRRRRISRCRASLRRSWR